ncbi:MAG TPA: hypothetical protein VGV67_12045, partial [Solirubrobacteraceae bacterium]|nr:hypothetical protein [Solirubrobacteraceae bacterium]
MRGRITGLVGVMALALVACGGGEDSQSTDPQPTAGAAEAQVRAVVIEALKTKDPSACTRLLTQSAIEQFTFQRGRKALAECRDDADEVGAKTVAVRRVDVDGVRAEADVEPRGGSLTLEKATFVLRKERGSWKIDALTAATLDRPAFMREAREELREEPDAMPPDVVDCVVNDLEGRQDAEIVRLYVDSDPRVLLAPTVVCAIRAELPRTPAARPFVECVSRAARRELTTGALGRELAEDADLGILESDR